MAFMTKRAILPLLSMQRWMSPTAKVRAKCRLTAGIWGGDAKTRGRAQ